MGVHFFSTVTNSSEVVIWTLGSGRRAIPYHSFDRCNYPRHAVPYVAFVMRVRSRVRVVALGRGVCCCVERRAASSRPSREEREREKHGYTSEEETFAPCRKYFQVCRSSPLSIYRHGRQSRRDMRTEYGKARSRVPLSAATACRCYGVRRPLYTRQCTPLFPRCSLPTTAKRIALSASSVPPLPPPL